jgi:hypothetical protein
MSHRGRVLYLLKTTRIGPSSRLRYLNYIPYLEAAGYEVAVRALFDERWFEILDGPAGPARTAQKAFYATARLAARVTQILDIAAFDLVVIEHQCFPYLPAMLEALMFGMRRIAKKVGRRPRLVVEFDDAIYLTPLHAEKLAFVIEHIDRVIVGNRELAAWALPRLCGCGPLGFDRVTVIPTVFAAAKYTPRADYARTGPFRPGWVGLPYNYPMLEALTAPLARVAAHTPTELSVLSRGAPPNLPGVPVAFSAWTESGEPAAIARFDAGLMPLPDTDWARGKCGAKLLQYLFAGVASVASPVGINADILGEGAGARGLAATTDDEWAAALERLAGDEALRAQLGRTGRVYAEAHYSLEVWGPRLPAIYDAMITERRTPYDFALG